MKEGKRGRETQHRGFGDLCQTDSDGGHGVPCVRQFVCCVFLKERRGLCLVAAVAMCVHVCGTGNRHVCGEGGDRRGGSKGGRARVWGRKETRKGGSKVGAPRKGR